MKRTEYYDAHSRLVFLAFKDALAPLMARIAPDWLLNHIEMQRSNSLIDESVTIKLVIKPIGNTRAGNPYADLGTGHRRLK